jgi:uncharacterized membrane protein
LVSAEDPDWQLRVLDVHTQFNAPSLGIVSSVGFTMAGVFGGAFLGARLSGNTNFGLLTTMFVATLAILLVVGFFFVSVSRRRKRFLEGLQRLATGETIPNFAEFLKEITV